MRSLHTLFSASALFLAAAGAAQNIPNAGFENWTNTGNYLDPDGWLTNNAVTWSIAGELSCERGSPGAVGNYCLIATDRDLTSFGFGPESGDVTAGVPGVFPGFPSTVRPYALTGQWQWHPQLGGISGMVALSLSHWNTVTHQREVIANGQLLTQNPVNGWQSFSVPLLYYSNAIPDSADIMIQATSQVDGDGSAIWVDDLAFVGTVGIEEGALAPAFELFPTPATDHLTVRSGAPMTEATVLDVCGRTWMRQDLSTDGGTLAIDQLPAGLYAIQLHFADGRSATRRFVKE
ncbi:MAG: hypothetical protein H6594_06380 [Flavobacteriales bacterium]|nr:hypothetical protein [Flavobacteriales bacterium]